jgi:hypothetical protein
MFPPDLTKTQLLAHVAEMPDLEFARFRYVQEMAGAYLAVAHFEDMLIDAMNMCDRVKVRHALGDDADRWEAFQAKRSTLQGSTLGSLIKILQKHAIAGDDLAYLKWIKDKRDHFVHRWFHDGRWPGSVSAPDCQVLVRQLLALQLWLMRAERRLLLIFERAGFVELTDVAGGLLITNMGVFDHLDEANS